VVENFGTYKIIRIEVNLEIK